MKKRVFLIFLIIILGLFYLGYSYADGAPARRGVSHFADGASCTAEPDRCSSGDCYFVDGSGVCRSNNYWVGSCGFSSVCQNTAACITINSEVKTCGSDKYYCNQTIPNNAFCAAKKSGGDSCSRNEECLSNNCNRLSPSYGKVCLDSSFWYGACGSGYSCLINHLACIDADANVKACGTNSYCGSMAAGGYGCLEKKQQEQSCNGDYECASNRCRSRVPGIAPTCQPVSGALPGGEGLSGALYTGDCPQSEFLGVPQGACGCASNSACEGRSFFLFGYGCSSDIAKSRPCAEGYRCVENATGSGSCKQIRSSSVLPESFPIPYYPRPPSLDDIEIGAICGLPSAGWTCNNGNNLCLRLNGDFIVNSVDCAASNAFCYSNSTTVMCANKKTQGVSCGNSYECLSNFCNPATNTCSADGGEPRPYLRSCGRAPAPDGGWACSDDLGGCDRYDEDLDIIDSVDCPGGSFCDVNPETGEVGCLARFDAGARCTEDLMCDSGNCESNICAPIDLSRAGVPERECDTSSECEEGETCITRDGEGGSCEVCEGHPDEDGDGLDDCVEDTCVGDVDGSGNCRSYGGGRTCSSLDGYLCPSGNCMVCRGDNCRTILPSAISREIGCCVSDEGGRIGCRGDPEYLADLGRVGRVDKVCVGDGSAEEKVIFVNEDGTETVESSSIVRDAGCGNMGFAPESGNVPGYGILAFSITSLVLIFFYFWNRKLLKY